MASGANSITKIAIIVVSVILGFFTAFALISTLNDGRDFDADKIVAVLGSALALALCILAFWGAYTENATLCYIALVFCAILLILSIWSIIQCFIKNDLCEAIDYIKRSIVIVIFVVMVVAVYLFIGSIQ